MEAVFIILIILAFLYGVLMLWYRYGWQHLKQFSPSARNHDFHTKVSIIIPARDEENHILTCLEAVCVQSYPKDLMEVIVVNDHSTDRTADLVRNFAPKHVRLINLADHLKQDEPMNSYKKKAIETAIDLCTGDLIITTDADCVMHKYWVETVADYYEHHGYKFIAAPVSYYREDDFFKVFQSLDFLSMQGITGAAAHLHCGTMCNGANLAYEKQAFKDVGAFRGIDCIASGDDMLLMYKMYKAYPDGIGYLKHPHAIVHTLPAEGVGAFMNQRIRWASKADKYDDKRLTAVLGFVYLWNITLFLLFVAGFFRPLFWIWCIGLILFKTLMELIFLWPVAKFFQKTRLLWQFFPAQFLHIPYIIVAGWLGKFGKYEWKNRRVR